jgi:hypothetical protein
MVSALLYNPLTPNANPVRSPFKSAITSNNITFRTTCTVAMSRVSAVVNGFKKTNNPPRPNSAIATLTVAKISTIMRPSNTPAVRPIWRFSFGSAVLLVVAVLGGSALISFVVAVMADVMRLICVPTWTVAAVFSRMGESAERRARVASMAVSIGTWDEWTWAGELTDSARVGLDGGVKVGQETECICTLGHHGAGNREAAEGEEGQVRDAHCDGGLRALGQLGRVVGTCECEEVDGEC